jgi:hypothetical protein
MAFALLGDNSSKRSNDSTLDMIRAIPRIGEMGGSSGCSASTTPRLLRHGAYTREEPFKTRPQRLGIDNPALVSGKPASRL